MRCLLVIAGAAILLLTACQAAPETDGRLLTKEQDKAMAEMSAKCDAAGGCAVVPVSLMHQLLMRLKACQEGHSL